MKVTCILACDDIRQESNNKHVLIGTLGPKIRVGDLPGIIRLAYYLQIEESAEDSGKEVVFEMQVLTKFNNGKERPAAFGKVAINFQNEPVTIVATPQFPIAMDAEGKIHFQVKETNKRWKTVLINYVTIDKSLTSPIALTPPV